MEFVRLISVKVDDTTDVKLHLITNNDEEYLKNSEEAFREIAESLESIGIIFTYEFQNDTHDRSIVLDNGWKILLGRGLDIFQKTNGRFDLAEYNQKKRLCKGCEITFLKNE